MGWTVEAREVTPYPDAVSVWWTPRRRRAWLHFRGNTNDWNTVTSVMEHDEYGLRERHLAGVAFDIGAHIGAVTVALAVDNPYLAVLAVEPVADNCRLLATNARDNNVAERVHVLRAAAGPPGMKETTLRSMFTGSETATHHAFIGATDVGHREVPDSWRRSTTHVMETVAAADYAELCEIAGSEPVFVKIDCEGGEWAFFENPGVQRIPVILGEWHNVPYRDRESSAQPELVAALPDHDVTFSGPVGGPGGFVAVRRG